MIVLIIGVPLIRNSFPHIIGHLVRNLEVAFSFGCQCKFVRPSLLKVVKLALASHFIGIFHAARSVTLQTALRNLKTLGNLLSNAVLSCLKYKYTYKTKTMFEV